MTPAIRWQVALAAKQVVGGIGLTMPDYLTPLNAATQILLQKKAEHWTGFNVQPGIVIVSEAPKPGDLTFNNKAILLYPVLLIVVLERSYAPESAQYEAYLSEQLRLALWAPGVLSLEAGTQFDADWDFSPSFPSNTWEGQFDVTAQRGTFHVSSPRAAYR